MVNKVNSIMIIIHFPAQKHSHLKNISSQLNTGSRLSLTRHGTGLLMKLFLLKKGGLNNWLFLSFSLSSTKKSHNRGKSKRPMRSL